MEIDCNTTALLVVDVLEGGASDAVYDAATGTYLEACRASVDACRMAGLHVIFCDDAHRAGSDRELDLWGAHGVAGTPEAQPAAILGSDERDIVIPKRRYSGFFQTDLDLTLRELGVSTVIVIGADTNICVLHTLADAFYLGYRSIVVSDATRSFLTGITEEQGLEYFVRCYGSTVCTSNQLATSLAFAV